jgi:flagellar biosynthetic protein FlhB
MADNDGGEKTEAPTGKKRSEARQEGNVPKSQEINSVLILLAAVVFLKKYIPTIKDNILTLISSQVALITPEIANGSTQTFITIFTNALITAFKTAIPVALVVAFFGVLSNILQTGFMFTTKPLMPKLSKINPISGFKKFFAIRSLVDTLKNIMKLAIIGIVAYITIKGDFDQALGAGNESTYSIMVFLLLLAYKVVMRIIMVLIFLAILDMVYQRYDNTQKLKMTKQEVKDERKSQDGNPEVKSRIRQLQREMASRRMMEEVPEATVVVTNPTHLSIAIKYDQNEMEAPIVVAKGVDNMAMKIREIATENRIPLYEDIPLARGMYDLVEPGDEVPMEFFNAVAEVLAYVYKLKGKI